MLVSHYTLYVSYNMYCIMCKKFCIVSANKSYNDSQKKKNCIIKYTDHMNIVKLYVSFYTWTYALKWVSFGVKFVLLFESYMLLDLFLTQLLGYLI